MSGLCACPTLAILSLVVGHVAASFSAITAAVAAKIGMCLIVVFIESNFAISASILYISLPICLLSGILLLTPCNVISIGCNNTNVAGIYF